MPSVNLKAGIVFVPCPATYPFAVIIPVTSKCPSVIVVPDPTEEIPDTKT